MQSLRRLILISMTTLFIIVSFNVNYRFFVVVSCFTWHLQNIYIFPLHISRAFPLHSIPSSSTVYCAPLRPSGFPLFLFKFCCLTNIVGWWLGCANKAIMNEAIWSTSGDGVVWLWVPDRQWWTKKTTTRQNKKICLLCLPQTLIWWLVHIHSHIAVIIVSCCWFLWSFSFQVCFLAYYFLFVWQLSLCLTATDSENCVGKCQITPKWCLLCLLSGSFKSFVRMVAHFVSNTRLSGG